MNKFESLVSDGKYEHFEPDKDGEIYEEVLSSSDKEDLTELGIPWSMSPNNPSQKLNLKVDLKDLKIKSSSKLLEGLGRLYLLPLLLNFLIFMDKIIIWNIRGIADIASKRGVRHLKNFYNLKIMDIVEPLVRKSKPLI